MVQNWKKREDRQRRKKRAFLVPKYNKVAGPKPRFKKRDGCEFRHLLGWLFWLGK